MPTPDFINDAPTLAAAVSRALAVYHSAPHIGWRPSPGEDFQWQTYAETADRAASLAAGLAASLGRRGAGVPRRGAVGILSGNRREWVEADLACALNDLLVVGVHPHWEAAKVAAVLVDSETCCVVADEDSLRVLADAVGVVPSLAGQLRALVVMPSPVSTDEAPTTPCLSGPAAELAERGIAVLQYAAVQAVGRDTRATHSGLGFGADFATAGDTEDDDTDIFTLMYSSGTSGGPPKATACPKAVWRKTNCSPGALALLQSRRTVSYMALAHGADRGVLWMTTMAGGCCGIISGAEGSTEFIADMQQLRPTFFLGMASFWQDRYAAHMKRLHNGDPDSGLGGVDAALADWFGEGAMLLKDSPEWEKLRRSFLETRQGAALELRHLRNAAAELGGALHMVITGGAPTPPSVKAFMGCCLEGGDDSAPTAPDGMTVIDSYGATEFPGISRNGIVQDDVELRLDPVVRTGADGKESLLYDPQGVPPRGEMVVRRKGTEVRQRYWKRAEEEAKVWSADGWYRTGDVGELDYREGARKPPLLRVIDRAKNVEELYWRGDSVWVDPGRWEAQYAALPGVRHVVLYGDRMREGLAAVVAADAELVDRYDSRCGRAPGATRAAQGAAPRGSAAALVAVPAGLRAEILGMLVAAARRAEAKEWEIPVACVVETGVWTEHGERGLLTLTGKPKRAAVKSAYEEAVGAANAELTAAGSRAAVHPTAEEPASRAAALDPELKARAEELLVVLRGEGAVHDVPERALQTVTAQDLDADGVGRRRAMRLLLRKGAQREVDLRCRGGSAFAGGPDWLAGEQALRFAKVRDTGRDGRPLPPSTAAVAPAWEGALEVRAVPVGADAGEGGATLRLSPFETVAALRRRIAAHAGVALRHLVIIWQGSAIPPPASADSSGSGALPADTWTVGRLGLRAGDTVRYAVRIDTADEGYYDLPGPEAAQLTARFDALRRLALHVRERVPIWEAERRGSVSSADQAVAQAADAAQREVAAKVAAAASEWGRCLAAAGRPALGPMLYPEVGPAPTPGTGAAAAPVPPFLAAVRAAASALLRGRLAVLRSQERRGRVGQPSDAAAAWGELDRQMVLLRELGDKLGVNTRRLPVTWRLDVRWVTAGEGGDEQEGTSIGGDLSCCCDLSGVVLDPEDRELYPTELWADLPARPSRRYHSLDSGVDRHPALHEGLQFLHHACASAADAAVPGAGEAQRLLASLDPHRGEWFVEDKQNVFWLHRWVKTQADVGMSLGMQTEGRSDTLASLILRSCSAFAARPALAIPSAELVPSEELPRVTLRDALPAAAGAQLTRRDGFLWLHYADLGYLVRRVAEGLRSLGLPQGATVAVCGYNDFEWAVADFAIAVAGYVTVGVHTTYTTQQAAELLTRVGASCLCVMSDLLDVRAAAGLARHWDPLQAAAEGTVQATLKAVVVMDAIADAQCWPKNVAIASFLTWVDPAVGPPARVTRMRRAALAGCRVASFGAGGSAGPEVRLWGLPPEAQQYGLRDGARPVSINGRPVASEQDVRDACGDADGSGEVEISFLDIPDPFEARGRRGYKALPDDDPEDLATILFTSGSSGVPKAVAVGVNSMVQDCVGSVAEWSAISAGLTVSYIPLSHSSDRMKLWQHVMFGGRVAFCHFAALHWEAHEKEKKHGMLEYTSPVDGLFRQIRCLAPSSMACPPNIWGGLYDKWTALSKQRGEAEALRDVAAGFGRRIKFLATGGAPTPAHVMAFAKDVCRVLNAGLVNSYGATECGAITADGRQEGSWGRAGKFDCVEFRLVDRSEIGFTRQNKPFPRGEVAVQSPSMTLGYFALPGSSWAEMAERNTREAFIVVPTGGGGVGVHPPLPAGRWYLTGDIGELRPDGSLVLIERRSAAASCADGAVVLPGQVEAVLEADTLVQQAAVLADPRYAAVCCVVVPSRPVRAAFCGSPERPGEGRHPAATSEEDYCRYLGSIPALAAVLPPPGVARLRFHIELQEWTPAGGLLSGELKKKRGDIRRYYAAALERLCQAPLA